MNHSTPGLPVHHQLYPGSVPGQGIKISLYTTAHWSLAKITSAFPWTVCLENVYNVSKIRFKWHFLICWSSHKRIQLHPSILVFSTEELMLLNCGVEDSSESLGLQGDPTSPFWRRSFLGVHWKGWCWSWNSNTLATSCEELTHWKRPWCWERLRAGGEGDDRGWDGWMASSTQWTWVWVDSWSWWWTGRPGLLRLMGSQRAGHDWATELNWKFCKTHCTNDASTSSANPLYQALPLCHAQEHLRQK